MSEKKSVRMWAVWMNTAAKAFDYGSVSYDKRDALLRHTKAPCVHGCKAVRVQVEIRRVPKKRKAAK